jgi:hypothetical protein
MPKSKATGPQDFHFQEKGIATTGSLAVHLGPHRQHLDTHCPNLFSAFPYITGFTWELLSVSSNFETWLAHNPFTQLPYNSTHNGVGPTHMDPTPLWVGVVRELWWGCSFIIFLQFYRRFLHVPVVLVQSYLYL